MFFEMSGIHFIMGAWCTWSPATCYTEISKDSSLQRNTDPAKKTGGPWVAWKVIGWSSCQAPANLVHPHLTGGQGTTKVLLGSETVVNPVFIAFVFLLLTKLTKIMSSIFWSLADFRKQSLVKMFVQVIYLPFIKFCSIMLWNIIEEIQTQKHHLGHPNMNWSMSFGGIVVIFSTFHLTQETSPMELPIYPSKRWIFVDQHATCPPMDAMRSYYPVQSQLQWRQKSIFRDAQRVASGLKLPATVFA